MNSKNSLLVALFITLASATTYTAETKTIEVVIETPNEIQPSKTVKNALTEQTTKSVSAISDATKASLKDKKNSLELEAALLDNVIDFVDACNKDAVAQNRKVTYTIENNKDTDTMTIKIKCKEEKPKADYWESIKDTVSSAASTVADKAKTVGHYINEKAHDGAHVVAEKAQDAGSFVKEKTIAGAHKVGDAAVVVKDKTVSGAHIVADTAKDAGHFINEKAHDGAHVVADKAQDAGSFVKEKTIAGAHKVGDAAVVVKDKAKAGIHSAAEKVADLTK